MSSQTTRLLDAFEALPEEEKRVFTAELLRLAVPYDFGALEDEELCEAAEQLFAMLDAEEHNSSPR